MQFARFLNESGIPWDAIHHQVAISRWIFDAPHPAATAITPGGKRRHIDLALLRSADFLKAKLPATEPGFQFDAFIEFGHLGDWWQQPKAAKWKAQQDGQDKVKEDVVKIAANLRSGACRVGYVIVFAECDYGFEATFAADAEAGSGCRVRFIRDYD
jgi:hypothetical protein